METIGTCHSVGMGNNKFSLQSADTLHPTASTAEPVTSGAVGSAGEGCERGKGLRARSFPAPYCLPDNLSSSGKNLFMRHVKSDRRQRVGNEVLDNVNKSRKPNG